MGVEVLVVVELEVELLAAATTYSNP